MSTTTAFIGGGQMAQALIAGILEAGILSTQSIIVAEPDYARRQFLADAYGVDCRPSAAMVVPESARIMIAVKPQIITSVLGEIKEHLQGQPIISIAAGISLDFIAGCIGNYQHPIIRVMPNTPALVGKGASALCCNEAVSEEQCAQVRALFDAVGVTTLVDESAMNGITAVSGSGPAYLFSFVEALIDGGVKIGLPRDTARTMAIQTVLGAAEMLARSDEHPALLRDRVCSPGGTTICAQHALERGRFHSVVMDAVEASWRRAEELAGR
jgi:pyrroline-5-carboxylate reductase